MLKVQNSKINTNDIKAVLHTIIIPVLLTIVTFNILYAISYLVFITFIYTKVVTGNELSDTIQFISKILFAIILAVTTLILIATNADFLTGA